MSGEFLVEEAPDPTGKGRMRDWNIMATEDATGTRGKCKEIIRSSMGEARLKVVLKARGKETGIMVSEVGAKSGKKFMRRERSILKSNQKALAKPFPMETLETARKELILAIISFQMGMPR
jgi:hypothetical protein